MPVKQLGHLAVSLVLVLVLFNKAPPESGLVAASDAFDWFRSFVGSSSESTSSQPMTIAISNQQLLSSSASSSGDLEREASSIAQTNVRSPAQIVRSSFRNGRYTGNTVENSFPILEHDLFKCVEPTSNMYRQFVRQYDRKFDDDSERLERLNLFAVTLRRAIVFNRILQNEVTNGTNYQIKPEIGNFHFVEPVTPAGENVGAIWYADITDCELGLIKHIMFDIMFLVDKNDLGLALKLAVENSEYLPLLTGDGFEQLTNILLLRLYDRFRGDDKMNQLFKWPIYMKKLAAYAYSLHESMRPNFKEKLALISFAYPAFFKDVKYNWPAINRTGDNLRANNEHKKFNSILNRNFADLRERNRRLVIFRQHWSLINQLNDNQASRFKNSTIEPDWNRFTDSYLSNSPRAEKLVEQVGGESVEDRFEHQGQKFRLTQFSDLTDAEFVAFMNNDYDLLANNKDSQQFLAQNFQVRPLDETLRKEIALELEFRRTIKHAHTSNNNNEPETYQVGSQPIEKSLARQVVDELISDVGLPIGPVTMENILEQEYYTAFSRMTGYFPKSYMSLRDPKQQNARFIEPSSIGIDSDQLTESDLADERQRRYEIFKENYSRFKAWWLKEGWHLNEEQSSAMLRYADMSWQEIKVTLFKICCLTESNLELLSKNNATIQYLGSNYQVLCQQMYPDQPAPYAFNSNSNLKFNQQQQQQQSTNRNRQNGEINALELFYYYSVHFNKHHSNSLSFERKFSIFRNNVDSLRKHSCKRDLTLFNSLLMKRMDTLNTIDVLDQRRSYTDDLNLDRFEYFDLPKFASPLTTSTNSYSSTPDVDIDSTRAGISYRRSSPSFAALLNRPPIQPTVGASSNQPIYSYADKLMEWKEDVNSFSLRYKHLNVSKIYDFVIQRYRYCMKTLKGIDLYGSDLSQQCQASGGQFDDKAAAGSSVQLWAQEEPLGGQNRLSRLQQQDQCGYYRLGLQPWAEGLIKQDPLSAQLIQTARCQQKS